MQTELDALRLILAKEHSFSPKMRYLSPDHEAMVPLLIYFGEYFKQKERMSQEEKRAIRLKIINNICESSYESFYQMTSWQLSAITNFLKDLEEEQHGKAYQFLEYVETSS